LLARTQNQKAERARLTGFLTHEEKQETLYRFA